MLKHFAWKKRKAWRLEWRDHVSGKQRCRSFDTREEAEQFERVRQELAAKEKILLARARKKAKAKMPGITVQELLDAYLAKPDIRDVTRTANAHHAKAFLELWGTRKVSSLSMADIRIFSEIQRGRGVMPATVNRRLGILRAACNWAVSQGYMDASPLKGISLPHAPSRRIDPPTISEIDRLLAKAPPHVQRIIVLGFYTGARPGPCELFRLRWEDVLLDAGVIYMPSAYKSKTSAARYIPIHDAVVPLLRKWKKEDGLCPWVIHYHGRQVRRISETWRRLCKEAGITRKLRPYDLRHAFATISMAQSGDIKSIAEIMGHTSYTMLLSVYQHVGNALKIKTVNSLPSVRFLDIT